MSFVFSSIGGLCRWSSPTNISRLIMSIWIDSIYRMKSAFAGCGAYVAIESPKIIQPFSTNADPSTAIPMVAYERRAITPMFHMFPGFMFFHFSNPEWSDRWSGKSFFERPIIKPFLKRFMTQSELPSPSRKSKPFPVKFDPSAHAQDIHCYSGGCQ